jgi:hypothetical protein
MQCQKVVKMMSPGIGTWQAMVAGDGDTADWGFENLEWF